MSKYITEDENMVYQLYYTQANDDYVEDKRRLVKQWGAEAEALLDKLLELRKTAVQALPMPLQIAIDVNAKHAILCQKIAAIGEPFYKAIEQANKAIEKGFKANLSKGVQGDASVILACLDHVTKGVSYILEQGSGLSEIRSCHAWFRDWHSYNCKGLIDRKAELEAQRNKHAAKWGE